MDNNNTNVTITEIIKALCAMDVASVKATSYTSCVYDEDEETVIGSFKLIYILGKPLGVRKMNDNKICLNDLSQWSTLITAVHNAEKSSWIVEEKHSHISLSSAIEATRVLRDLMS